MATRTLAAFESNSTDALFRQWINEVHNGLIAFGWTQTADTGQINFSTVTRPTAVNTYQGYAVYAMGDSLQATVPVFMRIDFGTGNATDIPAMKLKVAIGGTDGAGGLTGVSSTQQTINQGPVSNVTTLNNLRTAGSSSSYRYAWGMENDGMFGFAVERDQTTAGADSGLGVNIVCIIGRAVFACQFIETAGGVSPVESRVYAMISAQATQSASGYVGVGPVRIPYGPFRNPMKTLGLYARGDFTNQSTGPVVIYGVSHTYLFFTTQVTAVSANTWNTNTGFAFLWE